MRLMGLRYYVDAILDGVKSLKRSWLMKRSGDEGASGRGSHYQSRYGKNNNTTHWHFRRNKKRLWKGWVPSDIRKLADVVPGHVVVEVGGGEGVLALALSKRSEIQKVVSIDVTPARIWAAQELKERWLELGIECSRKTDMVLGDAIEALDSIEGADTIVASRFIYYLGDDVGRFFDKASHCAPTMVLIGNRRRENRWLRGASDSLGDNAYLATREGMEALLVSHGYTIRESGYVAGDPYVIGRIEGR